MKALRQATRFELRKILLRKKYIVLPVIQGLLCLLAGLATLRSGVLSIGSFHLDAPNVSFTLLPLIAGFSLPLLICMLMADLFAAEFENNSIKAVLLRPVSRLKIFTAKNLAAGIYVLGNLLALCLLSIVMKLVLKGTLAMAGQAITAYAVTILPMLAMILACGCMANLIRNASLAMFACIGLGLLLAAASLLFSAAGAVLFTNYTGYYKIWIGGVMPWRVAATSTALLLSNVILFFVVGYLLFDNQDA